MGTTANYTTRTISDNEGRFQVTLPTTGLKGTIFEKGKFSITASVTSESGETQSSKPLNFYLGTAHDIRPGIKDKIEITGDTVKLHIPVYDMAGLPERVELEYNINTTSPTDTIKGNFISPTLSLPASLLKSGEYKLEFRTEGSEEATVTQCVFWRDTDDFSPYPTPLWVPKNQYVFAEKDDKVTVKFGSYWEEWILFTLSDGEKVLKTKWLSPQAKLYTEEIAVDLNKAKLFVTLTGMHDFVAETGVIEIVSAKSIERLEIETESFRENISVGETENWKFKFKLGDKTAQGVKAFAVMSDQALNAIRDFSWNLNISRPAVFNKYRLTTTINWKQTTYRFFGTRPGNSFWNIESVLPGWETYGYPLLTTYGRIAGGMLYRSMATKNAMADAALGMAKEEAAYDDAATQSEMSVEEGAPEETELRPVEMPLAFFRPDLEANEAGELNIEFKVPNFNTTWQLQIAAYDNELNTCNLKLVTTASKPVMVKSNLPQFLRTGDKAEISAMIFNNGQEAENLSGRMEIFNPETGNMIQSEEFEGTEILPSGNKVISIRFTVPDNLSVIGVRTLGYGTKSSDGEQGFIAILPSSTPVTESKTFYGKSNDEYIELKIPKMKKDSNVTLKYCDNPLWEVLFSLPALTDENNGSSLSLAENIYGNLLARDIIEKNIEIENGLCKIFDSGDSTLTMGNLEKDSYLKIAALEATPWINQAGSETMRIRGLEKYLDEAKTKEITEKQIEKLRMLQMNNGGWSWFEGMHSSPYISFRIIKLLGYLKEKNLLNKELDNMASKAVKYYDGWLTEQKRLYKKLNEITVMDYLYSRNMLGYSMGKGMKELAKEAMDSIKAHWKHWEPGMKAKGGLVLLQDKAYRDEVNVIVKSLAQFLGKRMGIEDEVLILELFEKAGAASELTERVTENMLLQKETQDWNAKQNVAGIVYALMSVSQENFKEHVAPEIFIGNRRIELPVIQGLTGNYTINLKAEEVSGKTLKIKKSIGLPSWGGVVSQYIAPIADVKSQGTDQLTVEKHVYKEDSTGKLQEVKEIEKGDKVIVTLNVACRKDMDYVALVDSRSGCLQPEAQISGMTTADGVMAYMETRASKTSYFIEHLPAGNYVISYICHADREGEYSLGICEVQSLYAPTQTAHSGGTVMEVLRTSGDFGP